MDDEEVQFLLDLRETTVRTLRALKLQKATYGIGVPSHIDVGIRQAEKDITVLDAKLQTVQPSQKVTDAVGPIDTATILLEHRVKQMDEKISEAFSRIVEKVGEVAEQVVHIAEQVVLDKEAAEARYQEEQIIRLQRQQETDERHTLLEAQMGTLTDILDMLTHRITGVRRLVIAVIVIALMTAVVVQAFGGR